MPGVPTRQPPPDTGLIALHHPGELLGDWWQFADKLATGLSARLNQLREEFTEVDLAEEGDLLKQLLDQLEVDKTTLQKIKYMCWRQGSFNVLQHWPPYGEAILILRTRLNQCLAGLEALMFLKEEEQVKDHLKKWVEQVKQSEAYPEDYPQYIQPGTPLPFSGPH